MTKNLNRVLLLSPIWAYLGVLLIYFYFPAYRPALVMTILLVLGFPHFALTYPLIFQNNIKKYEIEIWGEKYGGYFIFLALPVFFLALFTAFYLYEPKIASIIFLVVNFFHITRQSEGILKLQSQGLDRKITDNAIQFIRYANYSILIFFVFKNLIGINIPYFLSAWIIAFLFLCLYLYTRGRSRNQLMAFITALLMYTPVFFSNEYIEIATLGITMHYIQYLYLGGKIIKSRLKEDLNFHKSKILFYICFTILFSALSGVMSFNLSPNAIDHIILIPMLAQLYHFITDAFIWKRNIEFNQKNIFRYL